MPKPGAMGRRALHGTSAHAFALLVTTLIFAAFAPAAVAASARSHPHRVSRPVQAKRCAGVSHRRHAGHARCSDLLRRLLTHPATGRKRPAGSTSTALVAPSVTTAGASNISS